MNVTTTNSSNITQEIRELCEHFALDYLLDLFTTLTIYTDILQVKIYLVPFGTLWKFATTFNFKLYKFKKLQISDTKILLFDNILFGKYFASEAVIKYIQSKLQNISISTDEFGLYLSHYIK